MNEDRPVLSATELSAHVLSVSLQTVSNSATVTGVIKHQ